MEFQKKNQTAQNSLLSQQACNYWVARCKSLQGKTSPVQFCKDHDVHLGTFYTWQRYRREGKYKAEGRFIALSVEPLAP